jgi:hypothetical protein
MRTTDFCPTSNPNGHPDRVGFRALSLALRQAGEPVRTAFHDAVARFGGVTLASNERFLLVERELLRHL